MKIEHNKNMALLKRIHVNKQKIAQNKKLKKKQPVISIKTSKDNIYCSSVKILGPSKLVYRPDKPLGCGAVLWIETKANIVTNKGKVIE